ncbi:MAG: hypothetical protein PHG63_01460 [Candidatus Dojkabacteria bacterium]|nr:hypothetical protein [Candidatus Dojkabacteria bacterium]
MQRDSHLFVSLTRGTLSYLLTASDYSSAASWSESLSIPLPLGFMLSDLDDVLAQSLPVWAESIGWDIVKCRNDVCLLSLCEGDCVGGVSLLVSPEYDADEFRSLVLGVHAYTASKEMTIEAISRYLEVLEKPRVLVVDLGWDEIAVYHVSRGHSGSSREGRVVVRESCVEEEYLRRLPGLIKSNILSVSLRHDVVIDLLNNVRARRIVGAQSPHVQDVLRAYITSALINMKDREVHTFGTGSDRGIVLVSGEMAQALPEPVLLLSVIDGLQLRGTYEIAVDGGQRMPAWNLTLTGKSLPLSPNVVFENTYLYISTERGASGSRGRLAFRGLLAERHDGDVSNIDKNTVVPPRRDPRMIVGQCGEIHSFSVSGGGSVLLQPAKSVFYPNLERRRSDGTEYLAADFSTAVDSIIIDNREIPIRYGPDVHTNSRKISGWVQGLPAKMKRRSI